MPTLVLTDFVVLEEDDDDEPGAAHPDMRAVIETAVAATPIGPLNLLLRFTLFGVIDICAPLFLLY
ncbi:hypothetical protein [Alicyclobacillus dauci]|uniref:Uncharacterized protein n=1 Tax=Alicyclobacillus dauci TaxID=1475485 RepID=A0ABY6Z412_9BACL|nr:hypothetical protein [Alicyclobacillus dauci]WAH37056.1 hypothetical protein NZD86_00280 [Alicyclobacillus dauci]